jgi:DNA-binding NarL/FixJ family response regulator
MEQRSSSSDNHSERRSLLPEVLSRFEDKTGPARVLVAEDDFLIAMQTEDALSAAGLQVVGTAVSAAEAIAMATQERPVLVVMDIRLAGRNDGIDAARELFQQLKIRCIFATANDDVHNRERARPYAPLGWLAKPYTMTSLLAAVADALILLAEDQRA